MINCIAGKIDLASEREEMTLNNFFSFLDRGFDY